MVSPVPPPTGNAYPSVLQQTPVFSTSSSKASSPATAAGTGWFNRGGSAGGFPVPSPAGSIRRLSGQSTNGAVGLGLGPATSGPVASPTGAGPATGWIGAPRPAFDPAALGLVSPSTAHHPATSWDQVLFDLAHFAHPHAAAHVVAVPGSPVAVAGAGMGIGGIRPGYEGQVPANGPMMTGGYGAGSGDVLAHAVGVAGFSPDTATPL